MRDLHSVYWLDAHDRVEWVNDRWRAFAVENDAPELADRVLGASLWEFVAGVETTGVYQALFARVREGRTLFVSYRCDAPRVVREFELELAPMGAGRVSCTTRVVGESQRTPVPLIDVAAPRTDELITMCSWCKRVRLDAWVSPEEAVRELGVFTGGPVPQITHGVCEECSERMLAGLG